MALSHNRVTFGSTGVVTSSEPTTTTTLASDVQGYLDTMEQKKADLDLLAQDLLTANANWDDNATSGATFADTKAAFQNAIEKAQVLDDSLTTVTPPAGYTALASLHADLSTAAAQVLSTTQSALAGLQSSDTGEARTAAIAAFNQAVAEFNSAYEGLAAAASEAPDTSG